MMMFIARVVALVHVLVRTHIRERKHVYTTKQHSSMNVCMMEEERVEEFREKHALRNRPAHP